MLHTVHGVQYMHVYPLQKQVLQRKVVLHKFSMKVQVDTQPFLRASSNRPIQRPCTASQICRYSLAYSSELLVL